MSAKTPSNKAVITISGVSFDIKNIFAIRPAGPMRCSMSTASLIYSMTEYIDNIYPT